MNNLINGIFQRNNVLSLAKDLNRKMKGVIYIPKPSFGKKMREAPLLKDKESGWSKLSHRVGAIGKKIGMMGTYIDGVLYPVTVLQLPNNQVTQIKRKVNDGVDAIQLGADEIRLKNLTKQLKGHFAKADVPPKRILMEWQVTRNAMNIPIGTEILAKHFVPGQLVNVQGFSKGKGWAGGMKRWNFKGQPASHGVSLTHRSIGSTGCRQTPGRVFKGKKMSGRLGNEKKTERNLQVLRVNTEMNCIMVKGAVPGPKHKYLKITDSRSNKWKVAPPFPTYFKKSSDLELDEELVISNGQVLVESQQPKPTTPELISEENYSKLISDINSSREEHRVKNEAIKEEKKLARIETLKRVEILHQKQKEYSNSIKEKRKLLLEEQKQQQKQQS